MPDMAPAKEYAEALLAERAGALRAGRGDRVIVIEEELRKRGLQVTKDGTLGPVAEEKVRPAAGKRQTAAAGKAPDRTDAKD